MVAVAEDRPVRRPTRGVRLLLVAFCCLTAAAVVSLVVLADRTEQTFAWTIQPPVTAAFLGSGYAAGLVLSALALRSDDWPAVRVPYVTVLVFTWFTAAATFVHLDRMHVNTPGTGPVAVPAAWLWLVVYVVIPVGMAVLLVRQERPERGRAPDVPIPRALAAVLALQGVVLLVVGVALFVAPTLSERLWPWTLTPLTARVVAAWLLAFAVAVGLSVADGDLLRLRIATVAYTAFGVFQVVTLLRFRDEVQWSGLPARVLVAMLVAIIATGAVGWALSRRGSRALIYGRQG
ncbi:hypothetical protein [Cellulomonas aerilata]|nr:hypothetical protein [Cellulomonas aerilata]